MLSLLRLGLLGAVMVLAACDTTTAAEHFERAQGMYAENTLRAAVIELKNALQKQPEHAQARLLLGQTHYKLGDYPSALKEFERSLDLGLANEAVTLGLLSAKVRLGRYQEVIGELEERSNLPDSLAVVLADAYLLGGDVDQARQLYQQALNLVGGNIGLGSIAWSEGDLERADHYFGRAVEIDPLYRDAWMRKADLELTRGETDRALGSFTTAKDLPGINVFARLGIVRTLLVQRDLDGAQAEVDAVLQSVNEFPLAQYLKALISYEQQDIDAAEAALREVQRTVPDHAPTLYLMGAVKFRQGQFGQAEDNLARYLVRDPRNESVRKLLASVRYSQNDLEGVVDTLMVVAADTQDPQTLALLGSTQLRLGRAADATTTLQRAVELAPDMAAFRNQLALGLISTGEQERAEAVLASAIEIDGDQFQSDYLIAMLRLREGDFDDAATAIEALIGKNPDSPIGYNLRGAVAIGQNDLDAAISAFETALSKDPGFLPAVRNLARLAESRNDLSAARARYEALLATDRQNEGALLGLADLAAKANETDRAIDYLTRAVAENGSSLAPRVALARIYLRQNDLDSADDAVDGALKLAPESVLLLLLRAETDLRRGDRDAAREVASRAQALLARRTENARLLLALGDIQARAGNLTLARSNLERVLALSDGGSVEALRGLARVDLVEGNLAGARQRIDQGRARGDDTAVLDVLEADLLVAEGNDDAAAALYQRLMDDDVRDGALRLALLHFRAEKGALGEEVLRRWLASHPQDHGAKLLLANSAIQSGDSDSAIDQYQKLMPTDDPIVLNNLAWLYMERGDVRAIELARRAYDNAPDNPDVADTLGWILVQNEQNDEAIDYLKQGARLRPGNPTIQYHLAVAQINVGARAAAKDVLETALSLGGFPEEAEARRLLDTLSGA